MTRLELGFSPVRLPDIDKAGRVEFAPAVDARDVALPKEKFDTVSQRIDAGLVRAHHGLKIELGTDFYTEAGELRSREMEHFRRRAARPLMECILR